MFVLLLVTLILASVAMAGLWFAKDAAKREEEERRRLQEVRRLRQLVMDIEEIILNLKHYDKDPDLLRILSGYLLQEAEHRARLAPADSEAADDVNRFRELIEEIEQLPEDVEPFVPKSDSQMAQARRYMAKSIRLLRFLSAKNIIPESIFLSQANRLKRISLNAEVKTYLNEGDRCMDAQEKMTAAGFYKHAKDLLLSSSIQFEGKVEEIKRISNLINNIYESEYDKKSADYDF